MNKSTVYFTDEQMATWESLAKREAKPKAEVLRDALEFYADKVGRRMPSAGIYEDDEVNSTNVDEWLRANWRPE